MYLLTHLKTELIQTTVGREAFHTFQNSNWEAASILRPPSSEYRDDIWGYFYGP